MKQLRDKYEQSRWAEQNTFHPSVGSWAVINILATNYCDNQPTCAHLKIPFSGFNMRFTWRGSWLAFRQWARVERKRLRTMGVAKGFLFRIKLMKWKNCGGRRQFFFRARNLGGATRHYSTSKAFRFRVVMKISRGLTQFAYFIVKYTVRLILTVFLV